MYYNEELLNNVESTKIYYILQLEYLEEQICLKIYNKTFKKKLMVKGHKRAV